MTNGKSSDDIPVSFQHNGKQYTGILSPVNGAGKTAVYHLYVNKKYQGTLSLVEDSPPGLPRPPGEIKYKWSFTTQKGIWPELADQFSKAVTASNEP